jgi:hypothetical protein
VDHLGQRAPGGDGVHPDAFRAVGDGHGTVDGGAHAGRVGQIAHHVVGDAARRPDLLGDRLQLGLRPGREQHPGALPGEQPGMDVPG